MKYVLIIISSIIIIVGLSSCEDSLGVNGTDYIRELVSGDTLNVDTVFINYKKVVIREIRYEKEIIYDTTFVKQPIVKANYSIVQILQRYGTGNDTKEFNYNYEQFNYVANLDYNYLTPNLDLLLTLTTNHTINEIKGRGLNGIIRHVNIQIPEMFIVDDQPKPIKDLKKLGGNLKISYSTIDSKTYDYDADKIGGIYGVAHRIVYYGEIKSIKLFFQGDVNDNLLPIRRFAFQIYVILNF